MQSQPLSPVSELTIYATSYPTSSPKESIDSIISRTTTTAPQLFSAKKHTAHFRARLEVAASLNLNTFNTEIHNPKTPLELIQKILDFMFGTSSNTLNSFVYLFCPKYAIIDQYSVNRVIQTTRLEFYEYVMENNITITQRNVDDQFSRWRSLFMATPQTSTPPSGSVQQSHPVTDRQPHPVTIQQPHPVTIQHPHTVTVQQSQQVAIQQPHPVTVQQPSSESNFAIMWNLRAITRDHLPSNVPEIVINEFCSDLVSSQIPLTPENIHHLFAAWCFEVSRQRGVNYSYQVPPAMPKLELEGSSQNQPPQGAIEYHHQHALPAIEYNRQHGPPPQQIEYRSQDLIDLDSFIGYNPPGIQDAVMIPDE